MKSRISNLKSGILNLKFLCCLLFALCSLPSAARAQGTPGTVRYPGATDTADSLFGNLKDGVQTTLAGTISSGATTITVVSSGTAAFGSSGSLKINSEIIFYAGKTSNTFTGCIRGRDGTAATTHVSGTLVTSPLLAAHHKTLVEAIIAVESNSTVDSTSIIAALGYTPMRPSNNLSDVGNTVTARTNLGLGTMATQANNSGTIIGALGYTPLSAASNLSDVSSQSAARTNLGLGNMALQNSSGVSITNGAISSVSLSNSFLSNVTLGATTFSAGIVIPGNVTATAFVGDGSGLTGIGTGTGGVINTGSTTIGADSDSDSVGVIDLQTRGTTRLRVLNGGDVNILGKLGINTATPGAPLQITVTYPVNTTSSQEMIRFTTPTGIDLNGITHHPFSFVQRTTMFGDDRTDSVSWGFNPIGAPDSSPSFHWKMEDAFAGGAGQQFELHFETSTTGGGPDRPFTMNVNRDTGDTNWFVAAVHQGYGAGKIGDTTANNFVLDKTDGLTVNIIDSGGFAVNADVITFNTLASGSSPSEQISIHPFPSNSAQPRLVFGDAAVGGSGISMARNDASSMRLYSGGSDLNPANWRAGTFLAYGNTWTTNPSMQMGGDMRIAAGIPIYFAQSADPNDVDIQIHRSGATTLSISAFSGGAATVQATFNTVTGGGYKFNGTKVVGGQQGPIPDSDGTQADDTRAINAITAAMRAHGLIAP